MKGGSSHGSDMVSYVTRGIRWSLPNVLPRSSRGRLPHPFVFTATLPLSAGLNPPPAAATASQHLTPSPSPVPDNGNRHVNKRLAQREALDLLLRADDAFRRCNPVYLDAVDNYAYLSLGEGGPRGWRTVQHLSCFKHVLIAVIVWSRLLVDSEIVRR